MKNLLKVFLETFNRAPKPALKVSLIDAIKQHDVGVFKQLLDQGADVNSWDSAGGTPAIFAAFCGHTECLALLIKAGVDVNTQDTYGRTAVMMAARWGHLKCLALLLTAGSDLLLQDRQGATALSLAQEGKHSKCVEMIGPALEAQSLQATLGYVKALLPTQSDRKLRI